MTIPWDEMITAATAARERAHAPYSRFKVGAAVWCGDGSIAVGCNVENRALPLSICAERTAMASAVAGGNGAPRAVVVVTDADPPATPCGMCREFLREFAADLPILAVNLAGNRREYRLDELLPHAFVLPAESERR
jgi:cytidine deaminase